MEDFLDFPELISDHMISSREAISWATDAPGERCCARR